MSKEEDNNCIIKRFKSGNVQKMSHLCPYIFGEIHIGLSGQGVWFPSTKDLILV